MKLICPSENSQKHSHVALWRVLWPVKKILVFLETTTYVWKLHPAVVAVIFYSVFLAFHYWQLLGSKMAHYESMPRAMRPLFPSVFPEWKIKLLHGCVKSSVVHCWIANVEIATSESSNTLCNAHMCNTKGTTIPRNPTYLKHLTHKQSHWVLFIAGCFFRQPQRHCKFHWDRINGGSNRLIWTIWLKIKCCSLCRCSALF